MLEPCSGRARRSRSVRPLNGSSGRWPIRSRAGSRPSVVLAEPGANLRPQILAGRSTDDDPDVAAVHDDLRCVRAPDAFRDDARRGPRRDLVTTRGDVQDRTPDSGEANGSAVHLEHVPGESIVLVEL